MKVEFLVSIKHPEEGEPMFLTREQARELYDALHAEFGGYRLDAGAVGTLPPDPLAPEWSITGQRLEAKIDLGRGYSTRGPVVDAETGPTLQDDIDAMVAKNGAFTAIQEVPHDVVPASGTVDDADKQEAEFLSRLPVADVTTQTVCHDIPAPDVTAEEPKPSDDKQTKRLLDAWHHFRAKFPKSFHPDSYVVGKVATRLTMPPDVGRRLLREQGISVDEPMSLRQAGQRGIEAKRAKVAPPEPVTCEPEPKPAGSDLLDRFPEPPANLDVLDALALTWEILEESRPQISSFVTTRVGLAATMAYKAAVEAIKPEYEAMTPFERREFKSAVGARWHKERAA